MSKATITVKIGHFKHTQEGKMLSFTTRVNKLPLNAPKTTFTSLDQVDEEQTKHTTINPTKTDDDFVSAESFDDQDEHRETDFTV